MKPDSPKAKENGGEMCRGKEAGTDPHGGCEGERAFRTAHHVHRTHTLQDVCLRGRERGFIFFFLYSWWITGACLEPHSSSSLLACVSQTHPRRGVERTRVSDSRHIPTHTQTRDPIVESAEAVATGLDRSRMAAESGWMSGDDFTPS